MKSQHILYIMIIQVLLISLILYACSDKENVNEPGDLNYRAIAYNSISDEEKATIVGNWQDAEMIYGIFKSDVCDYEFIQENQGRICFVPQDQNLELVENQTLVAVIFNTVNDPLLGPILVIVDPDSESAVGYGLRL